MNFMVKLKKMKSMLTIEPLRATVEMSERHALQENKWRKNVEEEKVKIVQLEEEITTIKDNHVLELKRQVTGIRSLSVLDLIIIEIRISGIL